MTNPEDKPIEYEQKQHLKEVAALPFQKRLLYYIGYYKWPVIIALSCVLIAVYIVCVIFFSAPTICNGQFINAPDAMEMTDEEFLYLYAKATQTDLTKNDFFFTSTAQYNPDDSTTNTRLFVNLSAGEYDFFIVSKSDFDIMAGNEFLGNVAMVLPKDLQEQYKDRFVYFDYSTDERTDNDSLGIVPVGINVTDSAILQKCGSWTDTDPIIFCFTCNTTRTETATSFLEWLLSSE